MAKLTIPPVGLHIRTSGSIDLLAGNTVLAVIQQRIIAHGNECIVEVTLDPEGRETTEEIRQTAFDCLMEFFRSGKLVERHLTAQQMTFVYNLPADQLHVDTRNARDYITTLHEVITWKDGSRRVAATVTPDRRRRD